MQVPKDWIEFVECLNDAGAEFLLVGGHAVAYHGLPRLTKDLDFFVRCDPTNAQKIVQALTSFGFAPLKVNVEDLAHPGAFVMLGHPPNRIDLITEIDGVSFEEAWISRESSDFGGVRVWVISKEHLIKNKRSAGRPQDIADAARLEALDRS